MPDDKIDEIDKSAEQETGDGDPDSALTSFLEDDGDDKGGEEGDDVGKKAEEKKAEEKETGDDDPDKSKHPDAKDEYPDELKERLKSPDKKPDEAKPPEQGPPEKKAPEKKPEPPETKPGAGDFNFAEIDDADLPDSEIKIGGHSINLKEYKTDYPEDYAAIIAIGSAVAKKQVEDLLSSGELVRKNDIVPLYADKATREDEKFWGEIERSHGDAKEINQDPKFLTWLDEQEEPLQRLAKNMETPADGILILDYYKKSIGKKKAKVYDDKKKTEQKRHVDIHKGSMRGKPTSKGGDKVDINDAKAAFEEDDDDDDY